MNPAWADHTIWWHVYPLGLVGAPIRERGHELADADDPAYAIHHRLPQVTAWLDHLIDLGANGLMLGPIFASATHGYDTLDYYTIDPRLGDGADFDALVAGARERGIRIMLDGVFNHVAKAYPGLADIARRDGEGHAVFEGHGDLIALDHADPRVADLVVDVMCHWLDRGADGWRLDAAYAVDPGFWAGVLPRVRERHPGAYIVGEMIHGDYAGTVQRGGMDAVTQYELWKAIWSSLRDGNFFELAHAIERHSACVACFVPWTFVGNHDVTRIASQVGDAGAVAALAVLMTLPGTPAIYYGDEFAYRGVKETRWGGDDAIRPALPAPGEHETPGGWMLRAHQELIALRRRAPWLVDGVVDVAELTNGRIRYVVSPRPGGRVPVADGMPHEVTVEIELTAGDARVVIREGSGERLFVHG